MNILSIVDFSSNKNLSIERATKGYKNINYIYNFSKLIGKIIIIELEEGITVVIGEDINCDLMRISFIENKSSEIYSINYCTSGNCKMSRLKLKENITLKKRDSCFIKSSNNLFKYKIKCNYFSFISLYIDLGKISFIHSKNNVKDANKYLEKIFSKERLDIFIFSNKIVELVEKLKNNQLENILDYFEYKNIIFELIHISIEEKIRKNNNLSDEDLVLSVQKMIQDNLKSDLNINEICNKFNITPYKIQKGFKNRFNMTVYEFIRKERISLSKFYLLNTNMPIICIANEVGYENPSKFTEAFKKYEKCTPSEFRKKYLNFS